MQKNVVLGASMGGLVARYALRDMELEGKTHDTRLYVSFDTPHQGANFPLGFQAMISHMNGMGIAFGLPGIYYYPPSFQFGNTEPNIGKSFKLLNSPAARQMLYYSVVGNGHLILVDNSIHDAFMADYTQKGYPQQGGIRNLVIANGSECGTDQGYSPHAEYVNSTVTDRLGFWGYLFVNLLTPLTNYPHASIGWLLTTRTEVKNQFIINALPNQQAKRVYYGKMYIRKKILFVIDINITLFEKSFSSPASFLPIDNAGGGVRDLEEFAEDLPFELKRSRFSFVPTFSALDIGGGLQPITYNEVTRSYSPAFPPAAPKNVVAANFFANPSEAGETNGIHTQVTLRNGRWLFQEITGAPAFFSCAYQCADPSISPAVLGPDPVCSGGNRLYTISNLIPGNELLWTNSSNLTYVSGQGTPAYTLKNQSGGGNTGFVSVNMTGECVSKIVTKNLWVGSPSLNATYSNGDLVRYTWPNDPLYYNSVPNLTSKTVKMVSTGAQGSWQRIAANPTNMDWSPSGNNLTFYFFQAGQTATFRYTASNTCGSISQDYSFKSTGSSGGGCSQYSVSPNPSNVSVNIAAPLPNIPAPCLGSTAASTELVEQADSNLSIQSIRLYDSNGQLRRFKEFAIGTKSVDLDISDLRKGIYILKVYDGSYTETHRVVIKE